MSLTELLLPAFVASLILTGIHAYLGVHVVERGVIFVDLSLAQIAALGTTVAYLMGHDLHSGMAYFYSLGFTFLGAAVFSFSRVHRKTRIPRKRSSASFMPSPPRSPFWSCPRRRRRPSTSRRCWWATSFR